MLYLTGSNQDSQCHCIEVKILTSYRWPFKKKFPSPNFYIPCLGAVSLEIQKKYMQQHDPRGSQEIQFANNHFYSTLRFLQKKQSITIILVTHCKEITKSQNIHQAVAKGTFWLEHSISSFHSSPVRGNLNRNKNIYITKNVNLMDFT